MLLGPFALIAQYALSVGAQRIIGRPGWLAYGWIIFLAPATLLTEPVVSGGEGVAGDHGRPIRR